MLLRGANESEHSHLLMKVVFLKKFLTIPDSPFSSYHFQEDLHHHAQFVDVRAIVAEHQAAWINDLAVSHVQLSRDIACPWWWLTAYSRLDLRPWGMEAIFKPLFFARAVIAWKNSNPTQEKLRLSDCPMEVALYLKEFDPSLEIEGMETNKAGWSRCGRLINGWILLTLKLFKQLFQGVQKAFFSKDTRLKVKNLVFFERFSPSMTLAGSRDYYYKDLFTGQKQQRMCFACLDQLSPDFKSSQLNPNEFFLLDCLTFADLRFALSQGMALFFSIIRAISHQPPCRIGGMVTRSFWSNFLSENLSQNITLKEFCVFCIFKRHIQERRYETIVYPYEEKGYERALLMACEAQAVKTIGYTPHPQHHLAVAMKDSLKPSLYSPSMYAVCGPKYVDYFQHWAGKSAPIHVWGSTKACEKNFPQKSINPKIDALLVLSHPHEMDVFVSWLRAEPMLTKDITYWVRHYQSVPEKLFQERFRRMTDEFPMVKPALSDFDQSLDACEVVLFNATSAGLLAVNRGRLAMHLSLDDFFAINPCFDDMEFMLHCATSKDLVRRLDSLRGLEASKVEVIWQGQKKFVSSIFFPVDNHQIDKDLS
jgi:hypothetical protein